MLDLPKHNIPISKYFRSELAITVACCRIVILMVFSLQSKTTTRQRCLAGRVFTLNEEVRPARQKQDKLRPNSLVGEGKAESVSCSTLFPRVGEAGSQQATSAASPSHFVLSCRCRTMFVLSLSDHVCLVVARPGVKGIIEMHRFNILLSCRRLVVSTCLQKKHRLSMGQLFQ